MVAQFPNFLKIAIVNENEQLVSLLLGMIQQALNFSYEPIWYPRVSIGTKLKNGTWTGIFKSMQSGECDLAAHFNINKQRTEVMDFSFPYVINDVTFMTNKPSKSQRTFAFVDAFSVELWIAVLLFYIFFSLMVYRFLKGKKSYFDLLMKLLGSLLGQSFSFPFRRTSKRFLLISWIFGTFLLTQSFRNTLLSFWSVPSLSGIRTIQELADAVKRGTYFAKTIKGSVLINMFLESTDESIRIIGQSMLQHDSNLTVDELLENYKAAYVKQRTALREFEHRFYLSDEQFFYFSTAFGIRKGFCCIEELNRVVLRLVETGLAEKIFEREWELMWNPNDVFPTQSIEQVISLNLQDIMGILYILLIGYALSLVVFIGEILIYMKKKRLLLEKNNETITAI